MLSSKITQGSMFVKFYKKCCANISKSLSGGSSGSSTMIQSKVCWSLIKKFLGK